MNRPKVVSEAEWVVARQELLRKEKEFTRERDALSAEAAQAAVGKDREGAMSSTDRAARVAGRSLRRTQPVDRLSFHVRHRMERGLSDCSFLSDHIDGMLAHLGPSRRDAAGDFASATVRVEPYQEAHGMAVQVGVVILDSDFNFDYHVSFTKGRSRRAR